MRKVKTMKNTKISYDGTEYDNIVSLNRSYNYSSFTYIDDNGSEVNLYLEKGKSFEIIDTGKSKS
ncbi:hypothetical protein GND98_012275 [Clostridium butyricum]|uniref:Uncharacterized protein n=1 Tax=Clostridium butyricum TaxID=1492 RepID=A0A6L9EPT3_CLOBU|nr:hypothetical protein [Clostridium butyricum]